MFAPIHPVVDYQPIDQFYVPDTTQRHVLGMKLDAVDPYWGYGEFVYGKAAAALNTGNVVVMQAALFGSFDKCPNTALLGQPVLVACNEFAINTYGWFQKAGVTMSGVKSTATVAAASPVGLTGAGTIGANTAGKEINAYMQLASQTATLAKTNVQTQNGSPKLYCPQGSQGWFLGTAVTGTGIPASTLVTKIDPDGFTVYTGSAVGTVGDKNSTATGAVTVTGTYTGYSIGHIESPFAQGAIT